MRKGADRAREIVVAKHNGRVVELDGDMEGPSLHLVHRAASHRRGRDRSVSSRGSEKTNEAPSLRRRHPTTEPGTRIDVAEGPHNHEALDTSRSRAMGVVSAVAPLLALGVDVHPS